MGLDSDVNICFTVHPFVYYAYLMKYFHVQNLCKIVFMYRKAQVH